MGWPRGEGKKRKERFSFFFSIELGLEKREIRIGREKEEQGVKLARVSHSKVGFLGASHH